MISIIGFKEGLCYQGGRYTKRLPSATYIRRERVSLQPQASAADWPWPPRGSASEVKRAERARGANEARLHNAIRTLGSLMKWLRPRSNQRMTPMAS